MGFKAMTEKYKGGLFVTPQPLERSVSVVTVLPVVGPWLFLVNAHDSDVRRVLPAVPPGHCLLLPQ